MAEFPRVNLPDVSDEERAEVARLMEKERQEFEIMRRNREGMIMAMLRKGQFAHGQGKRKK